MFNFPALRGSGLFVLLYAYWELGIVCQTILFKNCEKQKDVVSAFLKVMLKGLKASRIVS